MSLKHSLIRFKINGFTTIPDEHDYIYSKDYDHHNDCNWKISMDIERNSNDDNNDDPVVSFYLSQDGLEDVYARASFIIRNASGEIYCERKVDIDDNCFVGLDRKEYTFFREGEGVTIIRHHDVLDEENNILVDGALHVDIHFQHMPAPNALFVPPTSLAGDMMRLFADVDSADVSFNVGGTIIKAHKLILRTNAPLLYEFCKEGTLGDSIEISNISPTTFRYMLQYIYSRSHPGISTLVSGAGRGLLDAADRFGLVSLKLDVETVLVQNMVMDHENVAEWLVFAESKTCPLLKEAAVSFFVARATDLLRSDAWQQLLRGSSQLITEVVAEISKSANNDIRFNDEWNISVVELRKKLGKKGLDVDGDKGILISRLQESNKRQRLL